MKTWFQVSSLLCAWACVPLYAGAQSQPPAPQQPGYSVSVRQLSIPAKAAHEFEQGMDRLEKKDAAGSLPHFQRAIAEYGSYFEAYDEMGVANLKLGRMSDAERAFRKSIDVSGGQYAHPFLALGSILDEQERFAEAESATAKGLTLEPGSWLGHYYRALALYGLNRLVEAVKSAHEALRCKIDFPEAHLLLAKVHGRQEDYRALLTDLNDYLILAPDGPSSARVRALRDSVTDLLIGAQSLSAMAQSQP